MSSCWLYAVIFAWWFLLPIEKPGTVFSGNALDYKEIGPFVSPELCEKARQANMPLGGPRSQWAPRGCFEK